MGQLGLITGLYCIVLFLGLGIRRRNRKLDPLEPLTVCLVGYVLYSIVPLIAFRVTTSEYADPVLAEAGLLQVLGLTGIWIGYFVYGELTKIGSSGRRISSGSTIWLLYVGTLLIILGVGSLVWFTYAAGGLNQLGEASYGVRRTVLKSRTIPFFAGAHFANAGMLLLAEVYARQRSRKILLLPGIAGAIYVYVMFRVGSRLPLFIGCMALLIFYHYRIRHIGRKQVIIAAGIIVLVFSVWGRTRNISAETSIAERVTQEISGSWFNPAQTEFAGSVHVMVAVLEAFPERYQFELGKAYARDLLIFVPRALWPERPESTKDWIRSRLFPEMYRRDAGWSSSIVAEAYLNFGPFGPLIVLSLVGGLCRYLEKKLVRQPGTAGVLLACAFTPWLILMMRSTFISTPKLFLYCYALPILGALLIVNRKAAAKYKDETKV